jgi:solute carrier family 25 oxoglutarate transporter 11
VYAGISAAWLRQVLYGSARLGIFAWLLEKAQASRRAAGLDARDVPFHQKLGMGVAAGAVGGATGNPAEISLVRMGADASLPKEQRRNYRNSLDCVARIAREEGVPTLWRGAVPTVMRAAALSGTLLSITSELKPRLAEATGWVPTSVPNMFTSTLVGSFFANIVTNPLDVVKSRIQQAKAGEYTGMVDCTTRSVQRDGVLVLWRGFVPAFVKLAPYSIISITLLEKLTLLYTGGSGGAL